MAIITETTFETTCEFCAGSAVFQRVYGVDRVFHWLEGLDGAGSDHLAIWCGDCGPKHRN